MKYVAVAIYNCFFEGNIMSINMRVILVTITAAFLLSGCEGWMPVFTKTMDVNVAKAKEDAEAKQKTAEGKQKEAEDKLKIAEDKLTELKKNPPKSETITTGLTVESCTAMIKKAVLGSCEAKTAPRKPQITKPPVGKSEKGSETLPKPPVVPSLPPTARTPGGCLHTSNGTLVLKGTSEIVPQGNVVGRISDGELMSSKDSEILAMLRQHPFAFVTNEAHIKMCDAWIGLNAKRIQSQDGFKHDHNVARVKD
jgi:hypothetical protein